MQPNPEHFRAAFQDRFVRALFAGRYPDNVDTRRGLGITSQISVSRATEYLRFIEDHRGQLAALWSDLADDRSRETLLFHYVNRALGNFCSKAPHIDDRFTAEFAGIERFRTATPKRLAPHQWLPKPVQLEEYVLPVADRSVTLETNDISAIEVFRLEQYRYHGGDIEIRVKPGDVVIDGGACWGDTALYFAAQAEGNARIFAFELSQDNIDIMSNNLRRNPELAETVEIVNRPLAHRTGLPLFVIDKGAASNVSETENGGMRMEATTLDDFVEDRHLERVDFIKLDVEGAEPAVLLGAQETIRRFRPTLAVSVYHRREHPFALHEQVKRFGGDYDFYLKGVSLNYGETVLFCVPR